MSKELLIEKKEIITIEPLHDVEAAIEHITLEGGITIDVVRHHARVEGMHMLFIKKNTCIPIYNEFSWLMEDISAITINSKRYYYFEEDTVFDLEANGLDTENNILVPIEDWTEHLGAFVKPPIKEPLDLSKEQYIQATARLYVTAANAVGLPLPHNVYAEGYGLLSSIDLNTTTPRDLAQDIDLNIFNNAIAKIELKQAQVLHKRLVEWRLEYTKLFQA